MLLHIVKNNERIEDIIKTYHVSLDEIKKHNTHLTDYRYLASGTKLRIPIINEEVEQILDSTESFVMDYYPQIEEEIAKSKDFSEPIIDNSLETSPIKEEIIEKDPIKPLPIIQEPEKEPVQEVKHQEVVKPIPVQETVQVRKNQVPSNPYYYQNRRAYPGVLPPRKPYGGIKS